MNKYIHYFLGYRCIVCGEMIDDSKVFLWHLGMPYDCPNNGRKRVEVKSANASSPDIWLEAVFS